MAREYKDSGIEWIGQIPKEWETAAIKRLMCLYAGATPKSDDVELWNGNIPWITPADYKTEDVFISRGRRSISEKGLQSCATTILPVNSLVFSKRAPIGLVVLNSVPLCTNQGCIGCVPKDSTTLSKYYYYVLSAFTEQFELYGAGTTFKEISATNFANFIVCMPPFSTQQKIADYLDKVCGEVDEMVALQETMVEELKAYKQSVITEVVTKGLDPNVPMRDSGIDWIGEIPEHWEIARVGLFYFVTKLAGFEYTDTLMNKISSSEVVPIVRAQNVRMFRFENESISEFIDLETSLLLDRYSLNKKSLLMTFIGAGIGDVCIFDEPQRYHLAPNVAKIEKNSDNDDIICDEYIMFYFGSDAGKGEINKISKASAQASLSMSTIRKISITIPPISEQRSIASYLDTKCSEIDSLIALKQAKIEELKEYKKSVIYEYVTGKKEVV